MTYPVGTTPSDAYDNTNFAAYAATTAAQWEATFTTGVDTHWGDAEGGFDGLLTTADSAVQNLSDLGVSATATELNYVDGVTSAIQTQLDDKAETSHTHPAADLSDVTATAAELNYSSGVTSAIQTQIDTKADSASPSITGTTSVAQSAVVNLYNTADQSVNYERLQLYWSGDVFYIRTGSGGTGSTQPVRVTSGGGSTYYQVDSGGGTEKHLFSTSSGSAGISLMRTAFTGSSSSGVQAGVEVGFTANQSSTAGYAALLVSVTETATGSGTHRLIDLEVGGSSKASVDNTGALSLGGTTATWSSGAGTPESAVTAPVGSLFTRTDGGSGTTLYVKESGSGNTGWVAK